MVEKFNFYEGWPFLSCIALIIIYQKWELLGLIPLFGIYYMACGTGLVDMAMAEFIRTWNSWKES